MGTRSDFLIYIVLNLSSCELPCVCLTSHDHTRLSPESARKHLDMIELRCLSSQREAGKRCKMAATTYRNYRNIESAKGCNFCMMLQRDQKSLICSMSGLSTFIRPSYCKCCTM